MLSFNDNLVISDWTSKSLVTFSITGSEIEDTRPYITDQDTPMAILYTPVHIERGNMLFVDFCFVHFCSVKSRFVSFACL